MMPSSSPGPAARKHLRVLLPFSSDSLRIPDELAEEIGAPEAHVVVPFGKGKVRRVEVGRDGDGVFLGRGWPEFAAACGVGAGWVLVLRHHGGGVLTIKVFDDSSCFRVLAPGPPAVKAYKSTQDASRRPQFIIVLPHGPMEEMVIPTKFVRHCIPQEDLNMQMTIASGSLGKQFQIELKMNTSSVFVSTGWSGFLAFHGITEDDYLLLRYEGNMAFTVKVFGPNGCQRNSAHEDIQIQQTLPAIEMKPKTPSASVQECKIKNDWPSRKEQKKPKISKTCFGRASLRKRSFFQIGPSSWIKKVINTKALEKFLSLSTPFCDAIGLPKRCMITLRTSTDNSRSWQVQGAAEKASSYRLGRGWRSFCKENSLKEGDICCFNVVETTIWHVDITHYNENTSQECSFIFSRKKKRNNYRSKIEEQKEPETYSKSNRCAYEIGPPAWIKKDINTSTIENQFSLPLAFCEGIGLRDHCTITLKTPTMSSIGSWQARVVPYKSCSHLSGSGWKRFCQDNSLKEGDICTFNVVETTVWHVIIVPR